MLGQSLSGEGPFPVLKSAKGPILKVPRLWVKILLLLKYLVEYMFECSVETLLCVLLLRYVFL